MFRKFNDEIINKLTVLVYIIPLVILSATILYLSFGKGLLFFSLAVLFYSVSAAGVMLFPRYGIFIMASVAFAAGWLKTTFDGYNIDVAIGAVCLSVALMMFAKMKNNSFSFSIADYSLLLIAFLSMISMIFTLVRVTGFLPELGLDYQNYAINAYGIPSNEFIGHVICQGANFSTWFGLFFLARLEKVDAKRIVLIIVVILLIINSFVLIIQQFVSADFLLPHGFDAGYRLNGITSFCYALGAAGGILFLLVPAWFERKRLLIALLAAIVLLSFHGILESGSRSGLFMVVGAIFLWSLYGISVFSSRWGSLSSKLIVMASVVIFIGGLVVAYIAIPPDPVTAPGRLKLHSEEDGGVVEHLIKTRLRYYPLVFNVISAYPMTGVGAGAFYGEISKLHPLLYPEYEPLTDFEMTSNPPNMYLAIASEVGLPAMILFIIVLGLILQAALFAKVDTGRVKQRLLGMSMIIFCVSMLLGPEILNSEVVVWFWILAGTAAGAKGSLATCEVSDRKWPLFTVILILIATGLLHIPAMNSLNPVGQWQKLRWHVEAGVYLSDEEAGESQWTSPAAIKALFSTAPILKLTWRVADPAVLDINTRVSLSLDGELLEERVIRDAAWIDSYYFIGEPIGKNRALGIAVSPSFIPDEILNNGDKRELGICIGGIQYLNELPQDYIGFYPEEGEGANVFLWSGREGIIRVPEGAKSVSFDVKAAHPDIGQNPVEVLIFLDAAEQFSFQLSKNQKKSVEIAIEKPGSRMIKVIVGRTWSPAEFNSDSQDNRKLGLMVGKVRFD